MSYDAWLEAPYQRHQDVPPEAEDLLGLRVWIAEDDEWAEVVDWESWEDADEDGRYRGVDLLLRTDSGAWHNLTPHDVIALTNNHR